MARRHVMTPARKAALKKAQKESALKRKHKGAYVKAPERARRRKIARRVALGVAAIQVAAAGYSSYNAVKQERRKRYEYAAYEIRSAARVRRMKKTRVGRALSGNLSGQSPFTHKGGKTRRR